MPRTCTVCQHPDRDEIDARLIAGTPTRTIAGQTGLSRSAVVRHAADHVSARVRAVAAEREEGAARSLVDHLSGLHGKALEILAKAEAADDLKTALGGIREAVRVLSVLHRVRIDEELEARIRALEGRLPADRRPPSDDGRIEVIR